MVLQGPFTWRLNLLLFSQWILKNQTKFENWLNDQDFY